MKPLAPVASKPAQRLNLAAFKVRQSTKNNQTATHVLLGQVLGNCHDGVSRRRGGFEDAEEDLVE